MSNKRQKTIPPQTLHDYYAQQAREELIQLVLKSTILDIEGTYVYSTHCDKYCIPQLLHLTQVYPHLQIYPLVETLHGKSIHRPDKEYIEGISAFSLLNFIARHLDVYYTRSTSTILKVWMKETCANIKNALLANLQKCVVSAD